MLEIKWDNHNINLSSLFSQKYHTYIMNSLYYRSCNMEKLQNQMTLSYFQWPNLSLEAMVDYKTLHVQKERNTIPWQMGKLHLSKAKSHIPFLSSLHASNSSLHLIMKIMWYTSHYWKSAQSPFASVSYRYGSFAKSCRIKSHNNSLKLIFNSVRVREDVSGCMFAFRVT